MFIHLSAEAFVVAGILRFACSVCVVVNRNISGFNLLNQFFRNLDAVGNFGLPDLFPVKPCHFDVLIGCNNDTITLFDFFLGEDVLCTARTIRFYFNRNAQLLACLFEGFRYHVSMGDTGRASGDCQHLDSAVCFRCSFRGFLRFIRIFFPFHLINDLQECFLAFGCQQLCTEIFIHQNDHQTGEHFQMHISAITRSCNHK